MVQIVPREPSLGENLGEAFGNIGKDVANYMAQKKENEVLKKQGIDVEGLSPEMKKLSVEFAHRMALEKSKRKTDKLDEKRRGYQVGLGTIEAMKELVPKLGTSNLLQSWIPGTESSGAVQQYKTYANSLLGILTTIPVRNKEEFKNVKESLSSPRASQEQILRGIEGAEDIIRRHMESLGESEEEKEAPSGKEKARKVKFNPKNSEHLAKMRQLEKKFKGDKAKVNEALAREFE